MSYFVTCTFDLKNASRTDYKNAYADLKGMGLKKAALASNGNQIVAPTTMTMDEFNGESAVSVRDYVQNQVKAAFQARRFSSEIFVTVGGNWTWGAATT